MRLEKQKKNHFFCKKNNFRIDTFFQFLYIHTHIQTNDACLAQLVEQWTVNPCVAGSKPAAGDKNHFLAEVIFFCSKCFFLAIIQVLKRRARAFRRKGGTDAAVSARRRPVRSTHDVCDWKAKPAAGDKKITS